MTRPRLLILADVSDARLRIDVEEQATELGFVVTRTSTLRDAFSALGIQTKTDADHCSEKDGDRPDSTGGCDAAGSGVPSTTSASGTTGLNVGGTGLVFHDVVVSKLGRQRGPDQDALDSVLGVDLLHAVRLFFGKRVFFVFHSATACRHPRSRWTLFQDRLVKLSDGGTTEEVLLGGCNMVTTDGTAIGAALRQISSIATGRSTSEGPRFRCPWCDLDGLDEDDLCEHCPLYHTNEEDRTYRTKHPLQRARLDPEVFDEVRRLPSSPPPCESTPPQHCPLCSQRAGHRLIRHIHNDHGPRGRGEIQCETRDPQRIDSFALVVCVHDDHILLVQERSNAGYWLPGGHVDGGETLQAAALRETAEEAGVDVDLTGVLKIQYTPHRSGDGSCSVRLRVIFVAEPGKANPFPACKTLPDYESCGASWVRFDDVLRGRIPLRSEEPRTWVKYLREEKGAVHSLDVLSDREH